MLYEWHWTTYILYVLLAGGVILCIKTMTNDRQYSIIQTDNACINRRVAYIIFIILLLFLPLSRNLDIYPTYLEYTSGGGRRTIDPQAYVYQFSLYDKLNRFPEYDIKKILTLRQTEPLLYTIAYVVLRLGGNIKIIWLVVYGIIALCYAYFFKNTIQEDSNYLLLIPFLSLFLYGMSAIRSGLSFAFFYTGLACVKKKKGISAVLLFIAGYLSHYIIIFGFAGLIFDFLATRIKNKRGLILSLFALLAALVILLENYGASIIAQTKYSSYLQSGHLTIKGQLPVLIVFFLCLFHYSDLKRKFNKDMLFVNMTIFGGLLVPLVIVFGIYRAENYFAISRLYTWGMLIKLWNEEHYDSGKAIKVRFINSTQYLYDFIGGICSFIWFTKQVYDMRGDGLMPLFNSFI